ncbi:hypothetical protein AKJ43_03725 [candidate division MSBL1 archaeon SCGC-AAA261D19]|uniref:Uncharacterized protein n=1 Tax=candidate division MSBL1 archaeon SCGC-AAA261D19 TaxID=1698273 RepID=A0A133V3K1_9EURY|nr:hypothetical protein AKJ43_03725 [candidate division MSBL1 archaeon SCGC-AAA261D19]
MTDRLPEVVVKNQGIVAFLSLEVMAFLIFFLNPTSPAIVYATSGLFGLYLIYKLPANMVFSKKFCMLLSILIPFLLIPIATANPDYEAE